MAVTITPKVLKDRERKKDMKTKWLMLNRLGRNDKGLNRYTYKGTIYVRGLPTECTPAVHRYLLGTGRFTNVLEEEVAATFEAMGKDVKGKTLGSDGAAGTLPVEGQSVEV